jgi:dihydrofolate reductase
MRVVVNEFISLDGVVQAPGGPDEDTDGGFAHGGWSMPYFDPEAMGSLIDATVARAEAMLFGRRTWRVSADAWPGRAGDPFADRLNALPKHVASRTLTGDDMEWNSTLLPADDALGAVADLRGREGGDLLMYGSASLASALLAAGLVDELNLMIAPVALGGGKRLFPQDGRALPFELVHASTSPTGVQLCTYRPAVGE